MTLGAFDEDIRVAHADPDTLPAADLVRRQEIVRLLRTFCHELGPEDRRRVALIRASFVDAGDYVELLGTRQNHSWVLGRIQRVGDRFRLVEAGGDRRVFEILGKALNVLWGSRSEFWLGRATTNRATYPVGPIDLLEPLDPA